MTVDIGELLREHGLSPTLAQQLATERGPETVAKVLLNATYLKSQGKLQNAPGYIRAGLESGYELLPQVANRLESRRRELEQHLRAVDGRTDRERRQHEQRDEEEAIRLVLEQLSTADLDALVRQAVASLPPPLTRRNPSLSNPFVRARVYELAGGEPIVETDD